MLRASAAAVAAVFALVLISAAARSADEPFPLQAEFHFVRLEYKNGAWARRFFFGGGERGWWMQDWPEAEAHFAQGIRRLTRIDVGQNRHYPLADDRIFDHPWIYATQTGYWGLSDAETLRLRDYLQRGGFLVADDFYGPRDWDVFERTMQPVLPGQPIVDLAPGDHIMHVLFAIRERTFIPGLRHLRAGGRVEQPGQPQWRAIYDARGRMVVAMNFNMDVGDAWEHADWPEYPADMTGLAYRFGINYIIYAMTH
ncbi:MAG: DUF4159 domain-containing protein [Acidobacteria bacterium]|nr:DUF4159 domain-containing protein [Acidobacteriota bacterium]